MTARQPVPQSQKLRRASGSKKDGNGGDLGFEGKLWQAADKMRGNLDAAEYKHVVLGLIFLKYISDAFDEKHAALAALPGSDPEDRDEYLAENVFWVPQEARWAKIQGAARLDTIGTTLDDAMDAIERDNPRLKGVLPKDYARPAIDKRRLGELIDLIGTIGLGGEANRSRDILGRVYEYFLGQFASAEGKNAGEFYTPRSIVRLLVEMLAPHDRARIYDPCCGSGGMFVQSEKFIESHGGRRGAAAIFGQELSHTTWRLCQMNLAIRGIEGHIEQGDTLHSDKLPDLKADFVLANPPFNMSDWGADLVQKDPRWKYGTPPGGNANFAWVQHFIHHLAPGGMAGFVLANSSMSNQATEGEIRTAIADADLVDCVVALPGQLFYGTAIAVCLWFFARNKNDLVHRDHRNETLFIDARALGTMMDRTHRELTETDIVRVAAQYHAWRTAGESTYVDEPGFCRSVQLAEVRKQGYVLTPGRYVGSAARLPDAEEHGAKISRLTRALLSQQEEARHLDGEIKDSLGKLGYGD